MKTWPLERYASSTFNTCPYCLLYCMAAPSIKIYGSPSAKPREFHTSASIFLHWQQQVHADLLRDIALGILEKVRHGEPTQYYHHMVITIKHDGTSRRTVDFSQLNKFCRREIFASEKPLKLGCHVPSNNWKTVTDLGMDTTAFHYASQTVISLSSSRRLDDGVIQGYHKVSSLREMATIVASPPFCLILCERSDAWMTLCFLTRAREALVAHHPISYNSGPLRCDSLVQ